MAETFGLEYTALYVTKPVAKTQRQHVFPRELPATYTQVLAGAAADTVVMQQLPPYSMLDMVMTWVYGTGFTSGMTLSLGWKAYTDMDGAVQAASATGLYNAVAVSNTTFVLNGGMFAQTTPAVAIPVVRLKDFRNVTPVDLFATFNTQAPGAAAVLQAMFYFSNIA